MLSYRQAHATVQQVLQDMLLMQRDNVDRCKKY
jgi:hypothetical protein